MHPKSGRAGISKKKRQVRNGTLPSEPKLPSREPAVAANASAFRSDWLRDCLGTWRTAANY
eukprot:3917127-Karenia_brevis.AAC.1